MKTHTTWLAAAAAAVLTVAGTGGVWWLDASRQEPFPHEQHTRLFPFCTGCHEGVETDDPAAFYPEAELCGRCHNGTDQARVTWSGPTAEITNLRFTHAAHRTGMARDGMEPLECEQCHTRTGAQRMAVQRALPERCLACHEHEASDHYVDAECDVCHVPLARTEFGRARVSALPLPEDHKRPSFLLDVHGEMASASPERCAACHTQEKCTACHVDVAGVAEIASVPAARPGFPLGNLEARYPVPPSHRTRDWFAAHGTSATRQSCGTCHTRDDCAACHVPPLPAVIEQLPARARTQPRTGGTQSLRVSVARQLEAVSDTPPPVGRGPGVGLQRRAPASHAPKSFQTEHAALAAAQPQQCQACHTRRFCEDCHDAPVSPGFHPRNFTAQHASAAFGRRLECSTCHETRTFCRACHIQSGMEANGRLDAGFHSAEPLWLLRHAQAARQGLESCTSCHTQRDCMQCHSEIGAFGVNPHGPNFDAARVQKRNPLICFACHVSDPLKKGTT